MNQPNKLEPFPSGCFKKDLLKMYLNQMTESDILRGINEIIRENRKLPPGPIYVQRIRRKELLEFADIYGLPQGYYLPEVA